MALKKATTSVCEELGRLVVTWNGIELLMRMLVGALSKDPKFVRILTAHMPTTGLCDALKVSASDQTDREIHDRLLDAVSAFEALRSRRNYYVHSIIGAQGVTLSATVEAFAMVGDALKVTARRAYTVSHQNIRIEDLRLASADCAALAEYLSAIDGHFSMRAVCREMKVPLPPLPDKFVLPSTRPTRLQ